MAKKSKQEGRGQQIRVEDTSNIVGNRKVSQSGYTWQMKSINIIQGIMPHNLVQTPPQVGIQTAGSPSSWTNQAEEDTVIESCKSHASFTSD